jgi:hypothetical protein
MSTSNLLSKFKEPDVYAILCGYLYEFKEIPEYSVLSELTYLMDSKSFINLIKYFGGQTIRIPTREEFQAAVKVLLLLQYFEIEKKPWRESLQLAGFQTSEGRSAQKKLDKLKDTLKNYNYSNRNY